MINLYTAYFKSENHIRQEEIDSCLRRNIENNYLNIHVIEKQERLTYSDFFEVINKTSHADDINIISNSDIYFDHTIHMALDICDNHMYAITRYDNNKLQIDQSSDAWIFKGFPKNVNGNFQLGYWGCDGRIGYEFLKSGYGVYNPCLSIKIHHVHTSNIRTYTLSNYIKGPYAPAKSSTINNMILAKSIEPYAPLGYKP